MAMSEHDEQVALFQWAGYQLGACPELALMFAIPNGGDRHPAVAGKLRDEGVKAGVPDIFLPVPRGKYHGMFYGNEVWEEQAQDGPVQMDGCTAGSRILRPPGLGLADGSRIHN